MLCLQWLLVPYTIIFEYLDPPGMAECIRICVYQRGHVLSLASPSSGEGLFYGITLDWCLEADPGAGPISDSFQKHNTVLNHLRSKDHTSDLLKKAQRILGAYYRELLGVDSMVPIIMSRVCSNGPKELSMA